MNRRNVNMDIMIRGHCIVGNRLYIGRIGQDHVGNGGMGWRWKSVV